MIVNLGQWMSTVVQDVVVLDGEEKSIPSLLSEQRLNAFAASSVLIVSNLSAGFHPSHSQASNTRQGIEKPGRTILTLLLILNISMWVVTTFGLKYAARYSLHQAHYSGIAWKLITQLSMPLIVFFRFHSTICLTDIWSSAYRVHSLPII
ncbi:unnamed protein product [Taenia asiatica]|uniref:Transmembrane protein n=1 Tax=Taenia asiatica TaxID=60517 RepID=A0A0R3VUH3_TAEAS|nr:unnamed protein product [Taenia asiatica]